MGITGGKSTVKELRSDPLPVVWIYPKAYYLMSMWAALAGKQGYEFTCLGRAVEEDGNIFVTDAYAVKHKGTSGGVDMDDDAQIQLMIKLDGGGFDGDLVHTKGRVDPSEIRCWTHSHPGYGESATFWSSVDDSCIDRFLTGDWCVSIVFDQRGENPKCRIDSKAPRLQITADLQLYVPYLTEIEEKKGQALFKETSSKQGFQVRSPFAGRHGQHGQYGQTQYPLYTRESSTTTTKTTTSSSSTTSAKPAKELPSVSEDEDANRLQARIMSLFSLREDQVEEDWITWCRQTGHEFGDFTYQGGTDDVDDDDGYDVRTMDFYENDPQGQEALDGFEQELIEEGGAGQTRIPFVDMSDDDDGYDWTDITEIDSVGNEVRREAQEDEGAVAGAEGFEEAQEASEDEGNEVMEDVDVHHDTVPDADVGDGRPSHAFEAGLDGLAQSVVDNELTVEDALVQAQRDHDITAEEAEAALSERLGG